MSEEYTPACPACAEEYSYQQGQLWVCPMCGHEWIEAEKGAEPDEAGSKVLDSVGNELTVGDAVTITKGLKVKGGADIKAGTKVRGIRLLESPINGHDLEAKVPGAGQIYLKSSVVKKIN
ncbi:zinc ribbon domain-containing protein YjdM [Rothia sp. P4278]|uniref:zinc ribbon domain-containing protein YjdM n=1 Tax=Rothia sp. P4278 TaxID=3402658 RepID=UPI003AE8F1E5